jgi:glutamate--cysteine ligase
VQELLRSLSADLGTPYVEDEQIIAVRMPYAELTLEPGGQIEFSGFPELGLADNQADLQHFLHDVHEHARERNMFFIALGFDPLRNLDEQSWIHKRRYEIMRPYLKQRGGHAWDMMTRTAAAQVSIDYLDAEDLGRKYALGNRLGPIVAAMFANSPYAGGVETGLKSTRYAVWLDVDPDRTGPGPSSLEDRFDLREYVASVLEIPSFYVMRDGAIRAGAGLRLRELDDAQIDDFRELLSMVFTETRIREYVEMRSADSGSPQAALALLALWKGLTYDVRALDEALAVAPRLDAAAYRALQMAVARHALQARCEGVDVLATARDIVSIARAGLSRIAPGEVHYLDSLAQNVADGVAPADLLLKECGPDVTRAVRAATVA